MIGKSEMRLMRRATGPAADFVSTFVERRANRRRFLASAAGFGFVAARQAIGPGGIAVASAPSRSQPQAATPAFCYPIAAESGLPGDGFFPRHGFAVENTWFLPGFWHAGEDWYATDGDTAGANVVAVAAGEVVFAGSDYPGRVVIVQHAPDLFSMSGHLGYDIPVSEGQAVERGDLLGTVLVRADAVPNHLHFEMRTFLTAPEVNGATPRYGFACGVDCLPGPGYWPIDAPENPSTMGWLNPTHVINQRAYPDGVVPDGAEVVATGQTETAALWSAPEGAPDATRLGDLVLDPGSRFPLRAIDAGPEVSQGTSATSYHLWYQITPPDDEAAWVQAAVPSSFETGADGRPSSVRFDFLLSATAD